MYTYVTELRMIVFLAVTNDSGWRITVHYVHPQLVGPKQLSLQDIGESKRDRSNERSRKVSLQLNQQQQQPSVDRKARRVEVG